MTTEKTLSTRTLARAIERRGYTLAAAQRMAEALVLRMQGRTSGGTASPEPIYSDADLVVGARALAEAKNISFPTALSEVRKLFGETAAEPVVTVSSRGLAKRIAATARIGLGEAQRVAEKQIKRAKARAAATR